MTRMSIHIPLIFRSESSAAGSSEDAALDTASSHLVPRQAIEIHIIGERSFLWNQQLGHRGEGEGEREGGREGEGRY